MFGVVQRDEGAFFFVHINVDVNNLNLQSINSSYACNCINRSCQPSYEVLCLSQCLEKPMNPPPTTQTPCDPILPLLASPPMGLNANVQLDFITLLNTHCLSMLSFSSIWLLYSKSQLDKQWVPSNIVFAYTIFTGRLLLSPFPYSSYTNQEITIGI